MAHAEMDDESEEELSRRVQELKIKKDAAFNKVVNELIIEDKSNGGNGSFDQDELMYLMDKTGVWLSLDNVRWYWYYQINADKFYQPSGTSRYEKR